MELYRKVRLACRDGMSERAAARHFGISRESVKKMLSFSAPPGYRRSAPVRRPKLDGFTEIIDQWLREDLGQRAKQRHTAKRVFERLRDEHAFTGGYTIVKDYIREHRRRSREMFVPLHHPPGHAQADFGEATVVIGGVERTAHFFAFDLPHSDAGFVRAYPAATAEAWVDGHVHAFAFFGGVPQSVLYDNDRCLVARILPDGTRKRATLFSGFLSHYLIRDRYGRPGKGNDKGAVEGLVGRAVRCLRPDHRAGELAGAGALQDQRLLRAGRLWPPRRLDPGLRRPGGDRLRRRHHRAPSPLLRPQRHDLRSGALPALLEKRIGALDQAAPLAEWDLPAEFQTLRRLMEARMIKAGRREYVQVLRLLETFELDDLHVAVKTALRMGAVGFDAVKHLVLCQVEKRPPRLDLDVYPYLPRADVGRTSAASYMCLVSAGAA